MLYAFINMSDKQQSSKQAISLPIIPKGTFIVIVLSAIIACISLLDRSKYAMVWMMVSLAMFLLTMGLAAGRRRIVQAVMVASLAVAVAALVGFLDYPKSVHQLDKEQARADAIIAPTRERFTSEQLKALLVQDNKISKLQKEVGSSQTITYLKYGALIIGYSAILLYVSQAAAKKRR